MTTSTETISVSELEEMFDNKLPCGGNIVPERRSCPHDAPATMVSTHRCSVGDKPEQFKCHDCYELWVSWVMRRSNGRVHCFYCDWRGNAFGLYRPL